MNLHLEGSKTLVAVPTGKRCIIGAVLGVDTRAQQEMVAVTSACAGPCVRLWVWTEQVMGQ